MKTLKVPPYLRKGQAIAVFLHWLATAKPERVRTMNCRPNYSPAREDAGDGYHIADIFYTSDDILEAWWEEFVEEQTKEVRQ